MKKKDILRAVHGADRQFFAEAELRAQRTARERAQSGGSLRRIVRFVTPAAAVLAVIALAVTAVISLRGRVSVTQPPLADLSADFEPATRPREGSTAQTGTGAADPAVIDAPLPSAGIALESPLSLEFPGFTAADTPYHLTTRDTSVNSHYIFCGRLRIALTPNAAGKYRISQLCEIPGCTHQYGTLCATSNGAPQSVCAAENSYIINYGWNFREYADSGTDTGSTVWLDTEGRQKIQQGAQSYTPFLHYMGGHWFFLNRETIGVFNEARTALERKITPGGSDGWIIAADCTGSDVWCTVQTEEPINNYQSRYIHTLVHWDLETGAYEAVCTLSSVYLGVQCNADYVYFARESDDPDVPALCRMPRSGRGNIETVIAHFRCVSGGHWAVTDDCILYYSGYRWSESLGRYYVCGNAFGAVICCGTDGSNPTQIAVRSAMPAYPDAQSCDIRLICDRSCGSILMLDLAATREQQGATAYNMLIAFQKRNPTVFTAVRLPDSIG